MNARSASEPEALSPSTASRLISQGEIYWIQNARPTAHDTDSEAPSDLPNLANLAHPHVVIQEDLFNHSRIHTVVVCALTSNLKRAQEPGNVRLEVGEANLPKASVVVVSQLSSLDKNALGALIGTLSAERIDQILAGLRFQQRSFFNATSFLEFPLLFRIHERYNRGPLRV